MISILPLSAAGAPSPHPEHPMKLNPEDLEIVSFPTDDVSSISPITVDTSVDTNNPTPQTYCFVCD
jgi:hypothetical protein